ncbi:hypothetical protein HanRHA438_Chr15g0711781 [Helianthus annuus]|nr:hypothetical protein HanRHA438_Chr15g0711781 [Helianthus annuus]
MSQVINARCNTDPPCSSMSRKPRREAVASCTQGVTLCTTKSCSYLICFTCQPFYQVNH